MISGGVAVVTAAATGLLSEVAAHAFKGLDGRRAAAPATTTPPQARVRVPPPQAVPSISGGPRPLQPPAQAPAPAPPAAAVVPAPSGGS